MQETLSQHSEPQQPENRLGAPARQVNMNHHEQILDESCLRFPLTHTHIYIYMHIIYIYIYIIYLLLWSRSESLLDQEDQEDQDVVENDSQDFVPSSAAVSGRRRSSCSG